MLEKRERKGCKAAFSPPFFENLLFLPVNQRRPDKVSGQKNKNMV